MDRERTLVSALIVLQFVLGWGFLAHISPRFAGSAWGGVLGILASLLMLVPLAYTVVKRVEWIKRKFTEHKPMSALLTWHVYAGIAGSIFAILHSGHRFDSWLGIALITSMLLSVFSGYIGRHFLRYVARDLEERKRSLAALQAAYTGIGGIAASPSAGAGTTAVGVLEYVNVGEIVQAMAETEYSVRADEILRRKLSVWLSFHIWTSVTFYVLLVLHVIASFQYGIRWLA